MDHIYLDNNATTRIDHRVADAIYECHRAGYVNPASQHRLGQKSRQLLEDARETAARILGCRTSGVDADRVVFTSGGTEANNLAIRGLAGSEPGRVVVSAIEHPSVLATADSLGRQSFDVRQLRVSPDGIVDIEHLRQLLHDQTKLVSVMLGNNETGVLQPIREIAGICQAAGVPMHTDAVQAVGKIPVSFREFGVSALSLAAHKFHGPLGIGALVIRHGVQLDATLYGGFQQLGLRPGTESVALAVGLRRALELWEAESEERYERMRELRDHLEQSIQRELEEVVVIGGESGRLPHTSNLAFPGFDRQALFMALDSAGVACSTGSACASGSSERSPALVAMGLPSDVTDGSLRFSLGADTTKAEIDEVIRRILGMIKELRRGLATPKPPITPRQTPEKPV